MLKLKEHTRGWTKEVGVRAELRGTLVRAELRGTLVRADMLMIAPTYNAKIKLKKLVVLTIG